MRKDDQQRATPPSDSEKWSEVVKRQQEWNALDKAIREYVAGYEMRFDEGSHTPDANERMLIVDCINGLLTEDDFLDAIAKVFPVRTRVAQSERTSITQVASESAGADAPRSQRGGGMAPEVASASGMESNRGGERPPPSDTRSDKANDAFDAVLAALKRARDALYNGFEPENQSRAYRDVDDAIKAGGRARSLFIQSAGTAITCSDAKEKEEGCFRAVRAERLQREAETVLAAWHSVFGTSQLSHAQARLQAAEERATRSATASLTFYNEIAAEYLSREPHSFKRWLDEKISNAADRNIDK